MERRTSRHRSGQKSLHFRLLTIQAAGQVIELTLEAKRAGRLRIHEITEADWLTPSQYKSA
jgi:hypothetical protein